MHASQAAFLKIAVNICFVASLLSMGCAKKVSTYETVHPAGKTKDSISFKRTQFTEAQRAKLEEALRIANVAINDTLFVKILRAQEAASVYPWDYGRLARVDPTHHADPVSFFLSQLQTRGLLTINQFIARNDYSDNDVTGSTLPCSENINFNVNNLDRISRTPIYVAGTIVHERMHSFCFKHRSNNVNKQYNICDFVYHAGHVAITIALYRANDSKPIAKPLAMCNSLLKRLQYEKIIK
jgi:hypothetical protein